jgi:hypothetical protein
VTVSGANPSIFKVKKKYRVQSKAELSPELLHPFLFCFLTLKTDEVGSCAQWPPQAELAGML